MTERPAAASALAPFLDRTPRRVRFSTAVAPLRALSHVDGLLAGAAEVDITPPPGLPKAGYSSNAHDGSGFRTRLRARVVHLRAGTSSIAIVQCDLLGGSSVLQHLVAGRVTATTDLTVAGIMIGATHTHAGPGQFLGSDFYNRFASNRSGFDPAWTEFLVERISAAVQVAHDTRAPAVAAFGRGEVWGLTRNRSLDPHVHNATVVDRRQDPQRKYVAINPDMNLLRVDRIVSDPGAAVRRTEPLSAMVVFSVHGTGVSQHAREYNADLWAYLCGQLAHEIEQRSGRRCVVGAIEGTHADAAPNLRPGLAGHREAQRLGRAMGTAATQIWSSLSDELSDDFEVGAALREVDLDDTREVAGITLPRRAAVGAALLAGAKENLTPIINRIPPFRAGTPRTVGRPGPHGAKWVVGSRYLQPLGLWPRHFPRVMPLQLLRVGPVRLLGLPFEVTTEAGRRLVDAVDAAAPDAVDAAAPGDGDGRVVVSSVANDYQGYVTTPEEYSRQYYEGGHTLYGPLTLPFLSAHAARLAADATQGDRQDVAATRRWNTRSRRFLPEPSASSARRRFLGEARFTDPTATVDGYWEIRWRDVPPANLDWHRPLVTVEASDDAGSSVTGSWMPATRDGRTVDDQGWDLEVTHLGAAPADTTGTVHEYRLRWFDPELRADRRHRFVLLENNDRAEVRSPPFD